MCPEQHWCWLKYLNPCYPHGRPRWSCFYLLTVVNNAPLHIGVKMPLQIPTLDSFGYPGVELLNHMIILFIFLRNCHTIFTAAVPSQPAAITVIPASLDHRQHLHSFILYSPPPPTLTTFLRSAFPWWWGRWSIFSCASWPLYTFLEKYLLSPLPIF